MNDIVIDDDGNCVKYVQKVPLNSTSFDKTLKPIDNIGRYVTYNWLSSIINKIIKQRVMYKCDIPPVSENMSMERGSRELLNQLQKDKKKSSMMTLLFRSNPQIFIFAILVPLTAAANVAQAFCMNKMTSILDEGQFYNCDQMFSSNPKFQLLNYQSGLSKIWGLLWGYLLAVAIGVLTPSITFNTGFAVTIRMSIKGLGGILDLIYSKLLTISDQARSLAAASDITNLLFTDSQKISEMMQWLQFFFQLPIEFIIALIYMGIFITPLALTGLTAYLIFVPMIIFMMSKVMIYQKQNMQMKDLRTKRAGEILAGVKVVKLFGLEVVQHARLQNTRVKELKSLFNYAICMSFFNVISYVAAPFMTAIALLAFTYSGQFTTSNAFTTLFMYNFLAFAIVMLPMQLSLISDAMVSSKRIFSFLSLPNKDSGVVVRGDSSNSTIVIQSQNSPSFCWNLSSDKEQPEIMDPFYKEKQKQKALLAGTLPQLKSTLNTILTPQSEHYDTIIKITTTNEPVDEQMLNDLCDQLNIPQVSRLQTMNQYDASKFSLTQTNSTQHHLITAIHIFVLKTLLKKIEADKLIDSPTIIKNLNINIQKGELIGICGQVGSGKTSLFYALLGELRLIRQQRTQLELIQRSASPYVNSSVIEETAINPEIPHIYINGSIAYFSQQTHIFSKSVKENILYGKEYDPDTYNEILRICCLNEDMKLLSNGDQTEIGEKGVSLSGGQKARVALARALYANADIYLLDDPLSAVDAHVGKTIWDEVIIKYLKQKGKTILIASHQTHFFVEVDRVMQLIDGEVKHFGRLQQIEKDGAQIEGLTGLSRSVVAVSDTENDPKQINNEENEIISKKQDLDQLKSQDESSQKSKVTWKTYKTWLMSGSIASIIFCILFLAINQGATSYQQILISHWATDAYKWNDPMPENLAIDIKCNPLSKLELSKSDICSLNKTTQQNFINSLFISNLILSDSTKQSAFTTCIKESGGTMSQTLVSVSTRYLWLFVGLCFIIALFNFAGSLALTHFTLTSSKKLFSQMLTSLLGTNMRFFDVTSQGTIMNRLSKDTNSLDQGLTQYANTAVPLFLVLLTIIVTITTTNWPTLAAVIPAVVAFLFIYFRFKKAYPELKRMESVMRSPVFNICGETVCNLISIRAFKNENHLQTEFREAVKYFQSALLMSKSMIRWLVFRLGIISSGFVMIIIAVAVLMSPISNFAKYTGVILSQGFSLSYSLMDFVICLVSMEGEMTSVERISEYVGLPQENKQPKDEKKNAEDAEVVEDEALLDSNAAVNVQANDNSVEFKNVSFRYRPELQPVLHGISFKINSSEHVGVVGRTGAGKTSLSNAMYRLYESDPGSAIFVGGEDVFQQDIISSRKSFTIIPQDPFLFSGTLRQALCPFSQAEAENVEPVGLTRFTDAEIWCALEQVRMADFFRAQPEGLGSRIEANGDNLSAGQKQLVCVARALLRRAKCVILDEATAQVDKENDALIQETIRKSFADVTVLAIAHRLDTVIDFDRVIVMDKGLVAEFDTPANLIRARGIFYELVQQTGSNSAEMLEKIAFASEQKMRDK